MKMTPEVFVSSFFRILSWLKLHKIKAIVYSICGIVMVQYLLLPNNRLALLQKNNPVRTALMRERMNEAESTDKKISIDQRWVPLSKISKHLCNAVIVAEDGTFFEHEGIDWYEVEESIKKNIAKGKVARGGSTISQQLVKNLYLSTSKDPIRKLKEMIITLRLERMLSKQRILEIYLNVIEWGNGIFGAEAAARKYFGKSASSITRDEAARLAAIIPNPRKHTPNDQSRYVQRRSAIILNRMAARGF
jgi:monofunctional biosynthetic peptidoglycan transglycosylase